jgi:hypothetical protein
MAPSQSSTPEALLVFSKAPSVAWQCSGMSPERSPQMPRTQGTSYSICWRRSGVGCGGGSIISPPGVRIGLKVEEVEKEHQPGWPKVLYRPRPVRLSRRFASPSPSLRQQAGSTWGSPTPLNHGRGWPTILQQRHRAQARRPQSTKLQSASADGRTIGPHTPVDQCSRMPPRELRIPARAGLI